MRFGAHQGRTGDREDLLSAVFESCQDLRDAAWDKAVVEFAAELSDDPRWLSPFPLRPELHLRYSHDPYAADEFWTS